ncbi:hypothetical protein ENUP19_0350G0009 [Entamoeba nuttalli]|uniref:Leucine rich repeat and phosphatase domain containing protein n=2 Tax=Entamoeba nuttalli TaxID=412467 RepID=K2H7A1_ENTNP|nr:leucine rich repeat and phosphatase domain containing protein [Entamoeba nuttalli P19]EKE38399.1 leucine rich repeat and phosphatase domain containing protein [Entamoeba nuttalli P19]|eukprot:XP_008859261.1 leucine rich repeat and phosphatase domain containing protein [Entamoeba nuttalli P19]
MTINLNDFLHDGFLDISLLHISQFPLTSQYCIENEVTGLNASSNNFILIRDLREYVMLKEIDLSFNKLNTIPFVPPSLKKLNIRNNELYQCNSFSTLTELNISHNNIAAIPPMNHLLNLDCSFNRIFSFPPILSLTSLNIISNQLTSLDLFHESLIELKCSMNKLTSVILELNHLTFLDISINPLQHLDITKCSSLNTLYLNNCNSELFLSKLPLSLKELSLQSCGLNKFPIDLTLLSNLTSLNLSSNDLLVLPPIYTTLQYLKTIDISMNLLECFPVFHPSLELLKIGGNYYLETIHITPPYQVLTFPTLSPTPIIQYIHLGSFLNAHNVDYIHNYNISSILLVGIEIPSLFQDQCDILRLDIVSEEGHQLYDAIPNAIKFIIHSIQRKEGVLIICGTGVNKAPAIVIAFLMYYQRLSFINAFNKVQGLYPLIDIESGFIRQLKLFEKKLEKMNSNCIIV